MEEITEISFRHSLIKFLILQKIVSSLNIEYRINIRILEVHLFIFFFRLRRVVSAGSQSEVKHINGYQSYENFE